MDTPTLHLLFVLVLGLLAYAWLTRDRPGRALRPGAAESYDANERAAMPPEIASARLVLSEEVLYRKGGRPFAAKTDQGFLTQEGWLVFVETKTRRRMSASDLVQISAQAVAADSRRERGYRVANWGYIRLAPEGSRPYYQRVDLLPAERIDQLWDRWQALKLRRAAPLYRPHISRCRTCLQRGSCPHAELPQRRIR